MTSPSTSTSGDAAAPEGSALSALGHDPAVWVVPEFKILYVANAKNACTTLKWVMAGLAREDTSQFSSGLKPYVDDEQVVHNRDLFKNVRYIDELDAAEADAIHPDNGWFVFGVVRDARSRLFSAWQDKLLLHEPGFLWARDEPWFPQPPSDAATIVSEFARFVDAVTESPPPRLFEDDHFTNQLDTLRPDRIPYTRIYPIEQMEQLRLDLVAHVGTFGWTDPIELRRSNDNPLRSNAAVFADGVREKVEALYPQDVAAFGAQWDYGRIESAPEWTPAQIHEAQVRATIGRRLGDVRHIALHYRRKAGHVTGQLETLQRERVKTENRLTKVEARLNDVEGQVTRMGGRLTKLVDRLNRIAERVNRHTERLDRQADRLTRSEAQAKRDAHERRQSAARRPTARARRLAGRVKRRLLKSASG